MDMKSAIAELTFKLMKYRDAGLPTYSYFWINDNDRIVSDFFNSEEEAKIWINDVFNKFRK
jgi:hypothetical protein